MNVRKRGKLNENVCVQNANSHNSKIKVIENTLNKKLCVKCKFA